MRQSGKAMPPKIYFNVKSASTTEHSKVLIEPMLTVQGDTMDTLKTYLTASRTTVNWPQAMTPPSGGAASTPLIGAARM